MHQYKAGKFLKLKETIKNMIVVLFGLIISISLGETLLRVVFGDKFAKRPGFFIADDKLGWKSASNLNHTFYGEDFKIKVKTDSAGYRISSLGEIDYSKELIILLGDSYVFGWGVSTEETCASYLDKLVTKASNGNVRVANLGVGGYGTFQYSMRLERFIENHRYTRIAAVFVIHSPNDPVDNIQSIGYHLGIWKVQNRELKKRYNFHIFNFIDYSITRTKRRGSSTSTITDPGEQIDPYLRDMLYAYEYTYPRQPLPPQVNFNGQIINFTDISEEEYSAEITLKRKNLTRIQKDLMSAAVDYIYLLFGGDTDVKILHITLPTAPDWYVYEALEVLKHARTSSESNVVIIGKHLEIGDYKDKVLNDHSGGHYTPEFNEYWANKLMDIIHKHNIIY